MNRVMDWADVLRLDAGDRVWVEHKDCEAFHDALHTVARYIENDGVNDLECLALVDRDGDKWHIAPIYAYGYNRIWRAWEYPSIPTAEDRANAPRWAW